MNNSLNKLSGQAFNAQKRRTDYAEKNLNRYKADSSAKRRIARQAQDIKNKLKLTFLGGLEDVGEKNMAIIEYGNEAIVLDCGNNLGINLPGVNYAINDLTYLESIKHKLKAYVITHGHLDHIGGLRHTVPKFPAPIFGSRYTIGVIEKTFKEIDDFQPSLIITDMDKHEIIKIGEFSVEFIRVTHSIPDATAVCIGTPVGKIIATGDFRLDPEPLDKLPSDKTRLKQLGDEGVLMLLSDSSYADIEGRVPTEHTLQDSFTHLINEASGRIFVAAFSSNINRMQMIINAAARANRKVAMEGRSMLTYAEIAVRQGVLKVPKGTIVPVQQAKNLPDNKLLVMCTGGQGEPNASLMRMSEGTHKYVNLSSGDTVIISSSAIPGNELNYDRLGNQLIQKGVNLFRHPTHELDGCGPLHVSGHARRDELREMIELVRPKILIPIHGGYLRRSYHAKIGTALNIPKSNILLPNNGDSLHIDSQTAKIANSVPHGSLLVDLTGNIVDSVVIKDRLMLSSQGILTVILTLDKSGKLLTNPDIISRGFVSMKDNLGLIGLLSSEVNRLITKRYSYLSSDKFKQELRNMIVNFVYVQTKSSPIVIPVINNLRN